MLQRGVGEVGPFRAGLDAEPRGQVRIKRGVFALLAFREVRLLAELAGRAARDALVVEILVAFLAKIASGMVPAIHAVGSARETMILAVDGSDVVASISIAGDATIALCHVVVEKIR